jgi:hypothetical protein
MKKSTEKFSLENYTIIFTVKFGECGELQQGWITWESDGSDIPSAEEADRAWNAPRVPESLHATTRLREGSRRRVVLGGRGELEQVWTAWESDGSDIPSAEEADRAWNASRVPVSFHTITRHREGSRRRVVLGGRGEVERGRQRFERRPGTSVSLRDRGT